MTKSLRHHELEMSREKEIHPLFPFEIDQINESHTFKKAKNLICIVNLTLIII